jgi:hypothetical protein
MADLAQLLKLQPEGQPLPRVKASVLVPVAYTNESLVDWLVANPEADPAAAAKAFGRPTSWFLQTLASNQFQTALDPKRHLIADTSITATMEERFRSLTLHSLAVLHKKLDNPEVADLLVLKSAEIGVKALGLGLPQPSEQPLTPAGNVDTIAERLVAALEKQRRNVRTIDAEVTVVPQEPSSGS